MKVVPDTHNLLVPDTQITHWRRTEALNRPANITIDVILKSSLKAHL